MIFRVYIGTNTLQNKCVVSINDEDKYFSLYSTFTPRKPVSVGILRNGMLWIELCPAKFLC